MNLLQMEHVALSVSNLDRSVSFYRDLLGFELLRIIEPRDDSKLGTIVGIPNAKARIAHLTFGANMLELFEYIAPVGDPHARELLQADHGFTHLGFRTADARADYRALTEQGVRFISEPVEFRPGTWVVYFYGPDNEVCELRQDDQAPLPAGVTRRSPG